MENNEILMRFHTLHYEEELHATLARDHYRNAELTPVSKQVQQALNKAVGATRETVCWLEPIQRTALCRKLGD